MWSGSGNEVIWHMSADKQLNVIGRLSERYAAKPVIRSLLQLLPLWGSADVLLQQRADEIRSDRMRTFFDELGNGTIELTEDLIHTEDFLHCFFMTTRAALSTRQREKIKKFAKLLKSSLSSGVFTSADEYEEYLGILDELSCRELAVLSMLEDYESQFIKSASENDFQRTSKFWGLFTEDLKEKIGIPQDEIIGILIRLTRTGCYEEFVGGFGDPPRDGMGKLTPTYFRLRKMIELENAKNSKGRLGCLFCFTPPQVRWRNRGRWSECRCASRGRTGPR